MPMRAAIYCRVSTLDQSVEMQREELLAYAKARGFEVVKVYEDQMSGTKANRPALMQMERDAKERKFDCILIWKLDRLFRSLKNLLVLIQAWDECGVKLISLKDGLDLSSAQGVLMMQLLGAFAEFEASFIRMRVRAGIAAARAKGQRFGRKPYIDVGQVLKLRAEGNSLNQIARAIGATKAGVSKALAKAQARSAGKMRAR